MFFFLLVPIVYFFKMAQMPASVGPTGLPTVELGLDDGQALTAVRPPVCIIMHTRRTHINGFARAEQVIFRDSETMMVLTVMFTDSTFHSHCFILAYYLFLIHMFSLVVEF